MVLPILLLRTEVQQERLLSEIAVNLLMVQEMCLGLYRK